MDTPADLYKSGVNRTEPFSAWVKTVKGIARRLAGFFYFSEEDRENAGIYLGYDR